MGKTQIALEMPAAIGLLAQQLGIEKRDGRTRRHDVHQDDLVMAVSVQIGHQRFALGMDEGGGLSTAQGHTACAVILGPVLRQEGGGQGLALGPNGDLRRDLLRRGASHRRRN